MKACRVCKKEKPHDCFSLKAKGRTALQSDCKQCCVERNKQKRRKHTALIGRWKMIKGCQKCGFKAEHFCQLDLDHINPDDNKGKRSGHAIYTNWSIKRIKQELAKCQVLCKMCHSEKTYLEGDYLVNKSYIS